MAFDMGRELAEVGRRGVAGNFFVIKALGAASAKGAELTTWSRWASG
jgi:dihydroxyacetone kinase